MLITFTERETDGGHRYLVPIGINDSGDPVEIDNCEDCTVKTKPTETVMTLKLRIPLERTEESPREPDLPFEE